MASPSSRKVVRSRKKAGELVGARTRGLPWRKEPRPGWPAPPAPGAARSASAGFRSGRAGRNRRRAIPGNARGGDEPSPAPWVPHRLDAAVPIERPPRQGRCSGVGRYLEELGGSSERARSGDFHPSGSHVLGEAGQPLKGLMHPLAPHLDRPEGPRGGALTSAQGVGLVDLSPAPPLFEPFRTVV